MSGYQPFLIANTRVGLQRDMEPWLLPNDAYPELEDCYIWRGRIKKKQGYVELGRLSRQIGTTDGGGNLTVTIPGFTAGSPIPPGISSFIVGATTFQDGTITAGGDPVTLLVDGTGTATLDRGSGGNPGRLVINGAPAATAVIYQSGLPVMGLRNLELTTLNQTLLLAFDTKFSYLFNTATQVFNDASFYKTTLTVFTWNGSDSQFFWTTNYAGALWATNSVFGFQGNSTATTAGKGDGIKWFDQDQTGWVNFLPPIEGAALDGTGTNYLMGALIIVPYKGRLVVLNTVEGANFGASFKFQQRARWSQNGTPFNTNDQSKGAAPKPTNYNGGQDSKNQAWSSDIAGKGGFIDAPTLEQIVSAEFVKDTLIVYFERSTWQLSYTGNELLPFLWVKINTELGATSTFSEVPFDKITIGVGDVGIHACDSVNVERIDQKIPDDVFYIQNENNGRQRVYGIRDFFTQLVYWSGPWVGTDEEIDDGLAAIPPSGVSLTYPNKILVYNYIDQSFSFYNDSFTCFGYYERASDLRWADVKTEWQASDFPWVSPTEQQQFPFIVAGNQQGFVEMFDPKTVLNDDSLFITNISFGGILTTITSPNHNLVVGQFVKITSASGTTGLVGNIFEVTSVTNANTFIIGATGSGTYTGVGTITVVSNISIVTKRFNPFIEEGQKVRLGYVDLYVEKTTNGSLTVNVFIDEDNTIPVNLNPPPVQQPNYNLATNQVNTFPESTFQASPQTNLEQDKIWKRLYVQDISQLFQLQITMSSTQMLTDNIVESNVVIHGLILWFSKSGRLSNV